jgi:hypothetical protein
MAHRLVNIMVWASTHTLPTTTEQSNGAKQGANSHASPCHGVTERLN